MLQIIGFVYFCTKQPFQIWDYKIMIIKHINIKISEEEWISITIDESGCGNVHSTLKQSCPYCGQWNCYHNCAKSSEAWDNSSEELETEDEYDSRYRYNTAIDAVESLVLAHACAGINVDSKEYKEGLKSAIEAMANNL